MKHRAIGEIWFVMLIGAAFFQQCEPARNPSRFLIPDGYVGWVNIYFLVKDAPELPLEEGHYLFRILPSGELSTSSRLEGGIAKDDYYYVDKQDRRRKLESTGWGKGGMIWAESTGTDQKGNMNLRFFVGTEEQLKDFGFKMEKQVGPIPSRQSSLRQ
jgi:hypothetical protein